MVRIGDTHSPGRGITDWCYKKRLDNPTAASTAAGVRVRVKVRVRVRVRVSIGQLGLRSGLTILALCEVNASGGGVAGSMQQHM